MLANHATFLPLVVGSVAEVCDSSRTQGRGNVTWESSGVEVGHYFEVKLVIVGQDMLVPSRVG